MRGAGKRLSLSELLVGVVALGIVAGLAAPRLLRPQIAANESEAISMLRQLYRAEMRYAQGFPTSGFADDIAKLGPAANGAAPSPSHAGLSDFVERCAAQPCERAGYLFAVDQTSGAPVDTFRITAVPALPGKTGIRGFCASSAGALSYDPDGGKNCTHPI